MSSHFVEINRLSAEQDKRVKLYSKEKISWMERIMQVWLTTGEALSAHIVDVQKLDK